MDLKNINLMNDALFKAFMVHENNRELVVDFLYRVTGIEKEIIRRGTFVGGEELPKRKIGNKKQMTDTSILLENKRRIIVEMNQYNTGNLFSKNTAYAFSVIIEGTHKNIKEYPKVILINIDNFNPFKTKKPILDFKIRDEEGHVETKMYESIHLVLANLNNSKYNIDKELKKFLSFLKEKDLEKISREYEEDERYMAAIRTVEDLTTDPDLIGYYDYEEAKEQEYQEIKEELRKEQEKNKKEQEKIKKEQEKIKKEQEEIKKEKEEIRNEQEKIKKETDEVKRKAREEGLQEGITEANIETAKKLLVKGFSLSEIAECTSLTLEKITDLKNEMNI